MKTGKKIGKCAAWMVVILFSCFSESQGQTSSRHTVHLGISPITVMSVSGNPLPFIVETGADTDRLSAQDATTFYNLTTNIENVFIQVELDIPMPDGTELWVAGQSSIGNSHGKIRLQANGAVPMVSGIRRGLENGQSLEYEFIATDGAAEVPFQSRNVILTIVDRQNQRQEQHIQTVYFSTLDTSKADRK